MVALLVFDMQVGVFKEVTPRYDADGVTQRIDTVGIVPGPYVWRGAS